MSFFSDRKSINIIISLIISCMLAGCGSRISENGGAAVDDAKEDVELIEPVGNVMRVDKARFRELAKVSTLQGVVCPNTVEYTYESDQPFGNYAFLPGDSVNAGDVLFFGATDEIDESIENIEEENAALLADFNDYISDYSLDVARAKKNEFEAASDYQNMLSYAPKEDSDAYQGFAKGLMPLESRAKNAKMTREKLDEAYRERCELFDLEYTYNETRIARLTENRNKTGASAVNSGTVVAMNQFMTGDHIPQGTTLMAVGDPSDKEIVCDYISKSSVNKAQDIYAVIGGERIEVVYEVMEPEEYRRLKQTEEEVYTTFKISDPGNSIRMGEYAVIVVVESSIKDALCVPKGAVNKDDSGTYVYLYDGNDSIYTPVTVGESDGNFTQILGGLMEGDEVVYDVPYTPGNKTQNISRGEVHVYFSADGYLLYPSSEWMTNPAVNGTCYLNELCVDRFEQITEGQTLAKVEVVADNIEIERVKRKIERQNERIADLNESRQTTADEEALEVIDRAVRDRNRTIESLQKQLDKLSRYSGVVEIKAPYNGIVTEITGLKDGQIIGKKEKLVQIASDDSCYILVEDKNGVLSYGDSAVVTGSDGGGQTEAEGTVVSLNPYGLSKQLRLGYALIRVSQEDMSRITAGGGSDDHNGYWARVRLNVKSVARSMENVLLIPKNMVYRNNNDTYVIVLNKDGEYELVRYIAGGSDNSNYWVVYGDITEGMTICSV